MFHLDPMDLSIVPFQLLNVYPSVFCSLHDLFILNLVLLLELKVTECDHYPFLFTQHFLIFGSTFKKKAPNAIKEIRKFAQKAMGTTDVRVDVKLNKHIWSSGIRSVPRRVRVRIARRRNDEEDAKEELYSLVTVAEIPAEGLKGLGTKVIDEAD